MTVREFEGGVFRDSNVFADNIYFTIGQGCDTIWFGKIEEARNFIDVKGKISGHDSGMCDKCACRYSHGTRENKKYPEYACTEWKARMKTEAQS